MPDAPFTVYIDGTTRDGTHVYVTHENGHHKIRCNGEEVPIQSVHVFRDGGSMKWDTERGPVYLPHRLADRDLPEEERPLPSISGQPIYPRERRSIFRRLLGA